MMKTILIFMTLQSAFHGKVLDITHSAIAGAEISAVPLGETSGPATISGADGEFDLNLPAGTYTVTVSAQQFEPYSQILMFGENGNVPSLEIVLDIAKRQDAITVTETPGYSVVVSSTATKTNTPLRDIPQTVAVLSRELLRDQNAQSVADAVKNVPGVTIAQGEGNRDQVVLRGISSASDFYVNGIRDDQERFRDLYNVESIDVLQGPAAVLFGRGGAGGIVNFVTRKPARGLPSEITLDVGDYGHKRAVAQVGGSIHDLATFRVSAMGENSRGFRDAYFLRRYGINPTAGFDLPNGNLTVGFEHLKDHRLADRGIPSQSGRPVAAPPSQLFGSADQNVARSGVDSVAATFENRFNGATLRNTFQLGRYDKFYANVYPGSAVNAAGVFTLSAYDHRIDRTNIFNQTDLIGSFNWGGMRHTVLAGAEVGHQFQDETRHTAASIPNVTLTNSIRNANFDAVPLTIDRHADSNIAAGYLQDQLAVAEHWKAVLGARLDWFKVDVAPLSRADKALSPRVGLIYQPNSSASFYASYSYAFLPSGQNLGLAVNTAQLSPENAKNYEAGAKLDLMANRLNLSAAIFRLDRNNVKNTDPNDPTRLVLTGQQRAEGLTLTAAGNVFRQWRIYGGYSNVNARVTANTASAPAGRKVGLAPRSQVTFWNTIDMTERLGAGFGIVGQSKMYASFSNQVELPGFAQIDAVMYYRRQGYKIAVNIDNLFDTRYYATANGDNNISPGAPRSLRISFTTTF